LSENLIAVSIGTMSQLPRGGIFFPSAHVLLAIGFLIIHCTREGNFSVLVGGIEVREKTSVGSALTPPRIKKLTVTVAGLELAFSKLNTAVLTTEDGIRHRLAINGWREGDGFVSIFLSNDTGIEVSSSGQDGIFSLSTAIPATIPPVRSFEIPLRPASGTNVAIHQNNTLTIKIDDTEYVLILPPNSLWNRKLQRLVVNVKKNPALELSGLPGESG